jgi:hypothetical protein
MQIKVQNSDAEQTGNTNIVYELRRKKSFENNATYVNQQYRYKQKQNES